MSTSAAQEPLESWQNRRDHLAGMPPTPMLGRDAEIAALTRLLRDEGVRLLTITGPGGIGKTRLALQIALLFRDEFAGDVCVVSLASMVDPADVRLAIAEAVGVPPVSTAGGLDQLAAMLANRRILLMLDNFEHVAEAAPDVARLLGATQALTVLVTSRSPLRVRGEHEFPLGPIAVPHMDAGVSLAAVEQSPAVQLFMQRARAVRPDITLDVENMEAVAELCVRLDGLPLAIELAAARMKVLSPQAALARLEHRLSLLTGGALDLPYRLRTMRDAIAWSYDLLPPPEQQLFRRLAVLSGSWTLEAAAAVGEDATDSAFGALDLVDALVNKSLVFQSASYRGEPRFGMLETIRAFALEQLNLQGEGDQTRNNHAAYFLDLAELSDRQPHDRSAEIWYGLAALEHDNIRGALSWLDLTGDGERGLRLAGAMTAFWYARSHRIEGNRWFARLLERAGDVSAAVRATALFGMGLLAYGEHSDERAIVSLRACLEIRRDLNDDAGIAQTLVMLGIKIENLGGYDEAANLFEEAEPRFDRLGREGSAALAHHHRGVAAYGNGDLVLAERLVSEAVARHRLLGEQNSAQAAWIASALNDLGVIAQATGDLPRANDLYCEGLERWRAVGTLEGVADSLANLAWLAAASGERERAVRLFGAAHRLANLLGYRFELPERTGHEQALALLNAEMDASEVLRIWNEGQAMPLDEAIMLATTPSTPEEISSPEAGAAEPSSILSPRELEVLRHLVHGESNREIADALFLSPRTVQAHLANIFSKLGVNTRAAAVAQAFQLRLI